MEPDVVTAYQFDEDRTLTGTPFRHYSGFKGASSSDEASRFESAHSTRSNEVLTSDIGSMGDTPSVVPALHSLYDKAHSW